MSAIDLSRVKSTQKATSSNMNERRESLGNRKIIFETDSIEISIKDEPVSEDNSQHSDEEDPGPAQAYVDPMLYLAPFTPQPPTPAPAHVDIHSDAESKANDHADATEVERGSEKGVDHASGRSRKIRRVIEGDLRKVRLPGTEGKKGRGRQFVCECGEAFVHSSSLRIHRLQHTGEPRFKCQHCNKVVTTGRSLQNHLLTHSKAFRCKLCPKVFGSESALETHSCPGATRRFTCLECGAEFSRKAGLEKHTPTHLGVDRERTHVCEQCGKAFYQVGHLLTHRSVHSSERPYPCDQCDRAFSRNSFLTSHKRTHIALADKPRPFVCAVCANAFMRRCDLNKHELLHAGTRSHVCHVCGKAFSQSGHLVSHSAVHTGARPHQCQTCGKSFKRKTALRRHEVTPHVHSPPPAQPE